MVDISNKQTLAIIVLSLTLVGVITIFDAEQSDAEYYSLDAAQLVNSTHWPKYVEPGSYIHIYDSLEMENGRLVRYSVSPSSFTINNDYLDIHWTKTVNSTGTLIDEGWPSFYPNTEGYEFQHGFVYHANGGTNQPQWDLVTDYSTFWEGYVTYSEPTPPTGATFLGWATTQNATEPEYYGGDYMFFYDDRLFHLYAVYEIPDPYVFTLNYDADIGSNAPASQTWSGYDTSHVFTIPSRTPTPPSGDTFLGWAFFPGQSASFYPGDTIRLTLDGAQSVSKTLTAVYASQTYTVQITGDSHLNVDISQVSGLRGEEPVGIINSTHFIVGLTEITMTFDRGWMLDYISYTDPTVSPNEIKLYPNTAHESDYVTRATTITAHSTRIGYTVTFTDYANGSVSLDSIQNVPYGSTVTLNNDNSLTITEPGTNPRTWTSTPIPDPGYQFSYWRRGGEALTDPITDMTTFVVHFERTTQISTTFYRNYDSSDNTVVDTINQSVGSTFTLPTEPTRSGYTFAGWYTARSGGDQITSSTSVTTNSPTQIYAHWGQNLYQFTLVYDANGGSDPPASQTATDEYDWHVFDISPHPPTPPAGKRFLGWATTSFATSATYLPNGHIRVSITSGTSTTITLYAVYTTVNCTVIFSGGDRGTVTPSQFDDVPGGASIQISNNTLSIGNRTATATPIDDRYVFVSWSVYDGTQVTGEEMHISANFAEAPGERYVVTFDATTNGGYVTTSSKYVENGSTYGNLPNATKNQATFVGWFTEPDGGDQITSSTTVNLNDNQTLYARFTFDVTLRTEGGGSATAYSQSYGTTTVGPNESAVITVISGTTMQLTASPSTGYSFDSWTTTTLIENPTTTVTLKSKISLVAFFTANDYIITFDANGGSVSPSSKTVTYDSPYGDLPTPSRTGYAFDGWYTSTTGGTKIESSQNVNITNDRTFYAQWIYGWFTVEFDATTNGGTLTSGNNSKAVHNGDPYGTLPVAAKDNYVFLGWFTEATGGDEVTASTTVNLSDNQTLFAQFHISQFTLTLTSNDGGSFTVTGGTNPVTVSSGGTETVTFDYNATIVFTASPDSNHSFAYWGSGGNPVALENPWRYNLVRTDRTITAVWTGAEHEVTFDATRNGGQLYQGQESTKKVYNGETYGSMPIAFKDGYNFAGWFTAATGGDRITQDTTVNLNSDQTLYAQYDTSPYSIVVYATNGTVTATDGTTTITVNDQNSPQTFTTTAESITLTPSNTVSGYTFDYWQYFKEGDTQHPTTTTRIPLEIEVGNDLEIFAIFTELIIERNVHFFTNNAYYGLLSNGTNVQRTFDVTASVGDVIHISGNTITVAGTTITAIPGEDGQFLNWVGVSDGHIVQMSDLDLSIQARFSSGAFPLPDVFWDNKYINGYVDIAFNFLDTGHNCKHTMYIPLWIYDNGDVPIEGLEPEDGVWYFQQTAYALKIDVSYYPTVVSYEFYQGSTIVKSGYMKYGDWGQFMIRIDPQESEIKFYGINKSINNAFTFSNFNILSEYTLFDYKEMGLKLAINDIYHEDVADDDGDVNHPKFEVVGTSTWLDTYGFVMVDPSLNIYDKFPDYDDIRLNLYSFAMHGDAATFNGWTFDMDNSKIVIHYLPEGPYYVNGENGERILQYREYNEVCIPEADDAQTIELTLQNIYLTWEKIHSENVDERKCYLTFVDDGMSFYLGHFTTGNLEISFEGVWYFTTALYEPYTAEETYFTMDWDSWFNVSGNTFILMFIGGLIGVTALLSGIMRWNLELFDWLVVIGAGVVTYIMLGVF